MLNIFPWQMEQWQRLVSAVEQGRLPHALLLAGPHGVGLSEFGGCFAARLLCLAPPSGEVTCGQCKPCVLFHAGNHPDYVRVEPEEDAKQIKVDAIRTLIDFIHLTSQYGRFKIAAIYPADAMNRHAANTLLKTLEEPPAGSLLILASSRPAQLPATIRSRCQVVEFHASRAPETSQWLADRLRDSPRPAAEILDLAQGAPLRALELAGSGSLEHQEELLESLRDLWHQSLDPVPVARRWLAFGTAEVLQWLLGFLVEMARIKLGAGDGETRNTMVYKHLQHLADELDLAGLVACYDLVLRNYRGATGPISLNNQGLLEEVAVQWQDTAQQMRR